MPGPWGPAVWSNAHACVTESTATSAPADARMRNSARRFVRAPGERSTVKLQSRGATDAQHDASKAGRVESVMPTPSLRVGSNSGSWYVPPDDAHMSTPHDMGAAPPAETGASP